MRLHVVIAVSLFSAASCFASELAASSSAIYDPDPNHLWNRLFTTFYRQSYFATNTSLIIGPDVVDPPLCLHPRFMLDDEPFARCNAVLDEFLTRDGAALIQDPLKRAMLQRDLWAVFDVLNRTPFATGDMFQFRGIELARATNGIFSRSQGEHRVVLAKKVAQVIGTLLLSSNEIQRLPDTYRQAAASKAFRTNADPQSDDVLPADLFSTNSAWREVVPAAASGRLRHTGMVSARSLFRAFLKPPGGTNITVSKSRVAKPLPEETQFLLLREMVCLDKDWRMVPTHVVETIQFRTGGPRLLKFHSMISRELELNRVLLFEGKQGGLKPVRIAEVRPVLYEDLGRLATDDYGNGGFRMPAAKRCDVCHNAVSTRSSVGALVETARSRDIAPLLDWRRQFGPIDAIREAAVGPQAEKRE